MSELKPCPFCGGKAQVRYYGKGSGPFGYTSNILMRSEPGCVVCLKCEATIPKYSRMRVCRAIEAWNRRVGDGE